VKPLLSPYPNFFTASPSEAEEEKGEGGNLSAAQRSIIYAKFNKQSILLNSQKRLRYKIASSASGGLAMTCKEIYCGHIRFKLYGLFLLKW